MTSCCRHDSGPRFPEGIERPLHLLLRHCTKVEVISTPLTGSKPVSSPVIEASTTRGDGHYVHLWCSASWTTEEGPTFATNVGYDDRATSEEAI